MSRNLIASIIGAALAGVGCQQDNPVFMVGTAGNTGGASTGEGPATTTGEPMPVTTGGPTSSSSGPGSTSSGPDTEATTAVDPSTTTSGETTGTTTTTGETSEGSSSTGEGPGSSTGGESSSTGEESSTGEMECDYGDVVYHELYPLCGAPTTDWFGGAVNDYDVDCGSILKASQALPHELAVAGPFMQEFCEALELVPEPAPGGHIAGKFGGLMLGPGEGQNAEFFTAVLCATTQAMGTCNVQASAWVEYGGVEMILPVSKQVMNGGVAQLTIPLFMIPGVNAGEPFTIHMKLAINGPADAMDRAFFLKPRIRKKNI